MDGMMRQVLRPMTEHGHIHKEAFFLMWYRCKCGHMERFWNSRDGVTPFSLACPSCGKPDLCHAYFGSDEYAPNHIPHHGQRVWISMTKLRAEQYAWKRVTALREHRRIESEEELETILESLVKSFFEDGNAPDMVVTGYTEAS